MKELQAQTFTGSWLLLHKKDEFEDRISWMRILGAGLSGHADLLILAGTKPFITENNIHPIILTIHNNHYTVYYRYTAKRIHLHNFGQKRPNKQDAMILHFLKYAITGLGKALIGVLVLSYKIVINNF